MTAEDDEFERLMSGIQFRDESHDDKVTIPRWVAYVFCTALPAWLFLPSATATGNGSGILLALISSLVIGAGFYYYFTHYSLLRSFLKQEKPYRQVLEEHRESQRMLNRLSAETSPDARINGHATLTEQEDEDWEKIIRNMENPDQK